MNSLLLKSRRAAAFQSVLAGILCQGRDLRAGGTAPESQPKTLADLLYGPGGGGSHAVGKVPGLFNHQRIVEQGQCLKGSQRAAAFRHQQRRIRTVQALHERILHAPHQEAVHAPPPGCGAGDVEAGVVIDRRVIILEEEVLLPRGHPSAGRSGRPPRARCRARPRHQAECGSCATETDCRCRSWLGQDARPRIAGRLR